MQFKRQKCPTHLTLNKIKESPGVEGSIFPRTFSKIKPLIERVTLTKNVFYGICRVKENSISVTINNSNCKNGYKITK